LRPFIRLQAGEIFRMRDVETSVEALNALGRFKTITEADYLLIPDDKLGLITVIFNLKPKS
jgi:hypothetical protein